MYPDQSHSLPQVRQHQYLAMEDFFDGAFQSDVSTSRNQDMFGIDMDAILYGHKKRQQKAKPPKSDKHKQQQKKKKNSTITDY